MRTVRTGELRSNTRSKQSALIADLACIGRINKFDSQAVSLCSVSDALYQQIIAKTVEFSSSSLSNRLLLRSSFNPKIFKNENRIFRNPFTKFCSRFSTKCFSKITLFPRQTFQDTANRSAILAQFLFRGFFRL